MMINHRRILTCCWLLVWGTWGALPCGAEEEAKPAAEIKYPKAFTATYEANLSGIPVTATRTLKTLDNGEQELRFTAKSWIGKIEELTQFQWDPQGQLIPRNYEYHRTGLGRDRHAVLNFDWEEKKVKNDVQKKPWTMAIPDLTQDKLSYQLQLRNDLLNHKPLLSYSVADGGHIKEYLFESLQEEELDTPVGKLKTVKVKRIREDDTRTTFLWFATDWDYLIVRIQQREENGKPYEIKLDHAKVNGIEVKGS